MKSMFIYALAGGAIGISGSIGVGHLYQHYNEVAILDPVDVRNFERCLNYRLSDSFEFSEFTINSHDYAEAVFNDGENSFHVILSPKEAATESEKLDESSVGYYFELVSSVCDGKTDGLSADVYMVIEENYQNPIEFSI